MRPEAGGHSGDSRGWRCRTPEGVDRKGTAFPATHLGQVSRPRPPAGCRQLSPHAPFSSGSSGRLRARNGVPFPFRAANTCLHPGDGRCRTRCPQPAETCARGGNCGSIPGIPGTGDSPAARAQSGAGFPRTRPRGGAGPGTNGARVLGVRGQAPGLASR